MTRQNIKKRLTNKKKKTAIIKGKRKNRGVDEEKGINFNLLLLITFCTGVILIFATYAWFSATLNVTISSFEMIVSNHTGLFISLDGREFTSSVNVSRDSLITDLKNSYPSNTNQWASAGLFAASSIGIRDKNTSKFDIYAGAGKGKADDDMADKVEDQVNACIDTCDNKCNGFKQEADQLACFNDCVSGCEDIRDFFGAKVGLSTRLVNEGGPSPSNIYIAFDFFLKNVSGSPKSDNLYFDNGTAISYVDAAHGDEDGIINSLRIGLVKMGSVPLKSDVNTIQRITCNNNCQMVIYEPNSKSHSENSIYRATKYGIKLVDGEYVPTYAVISEGDNLELANGHVGSGIPLDTLHFAEQKTIVDADFKKPIFTIPNAITKMRAYVWIEGQDIDSLETKSKGGAMNVIINLIKDLAGYY